MYESNNTAVAAVSMEAIHSAAAKLAATNPEMFARANELQQLAGKDGMISCQRADLDDANTIEQSNVMWKWVWPF